MQAPQEYYSSSVGYCTIWGDVVDKPEMVIVSENSDYGTLTVVKRSELQKREDTWEFKQAEKRKAELDKITADAQKNLDKIVDKVIDKALKSLASRIKMNVAFGDGGSSSYAALMISTELEKMIKEKAPEVVKGKELPF